MQNNMTPLINCTRFTNFPLSASFTNEQGLGLTERHHTPLHGIAGHDTGGSHATHLTGTEGNTRPFIGLSGETLPKYTKNSFPLR